MPSSTLHPAALVPGFGDVCADKTFERSMDFFAEASVTNTSVLHSHLLFGANIGLPGKLCSDRAEFWHLAGVAALARNLDAISVTAGLRQCCAVHRGTGVTPTGVTAVCAPSTRRPWDVLVGGHLAPALFLLHSHGVIVTMGKCWINTSWEGRFHEQLTRALRFCQEQERQVCRSAQATRASLHSLGDFSI